MLKIKVNEKYSYEFDSANGLPTVFASHDTLDLSESGEGCFQIFHNNTVYHAELIDLNRLEKKCTIRVNSGVYTIDVKDQFDALLEQLGMSGLSSGKAVELKAPMPGMVLKVLVNPGDRVKKGDSLLILEAMKMENVIKAAADGSISDITVKPGDKVEKNQVLISFS